MQTTTTLKNSVLLTALSFLSIQLYSSQALLYQNCQKQASSYSAASSASAGASSSFQTPSQQPTIASTTTEEGCKAICYFTGYREKQDYQEAYQLFEAATTLRDIPATSNLGVCLLEGKGTPKNRARAFGLFSISAQAGLPEAQYNLGICYRDGIFISQDLQKAQEFLTKAAEQKNAKALEALYVIANRYYHGTGTAKNLTAAFELFKEVAQHKHVAAEYAVGVCYLYGEGVRKNVARALIYFRQAALHGNLDAQAIMYTLEKKRYAKLFESRFSSPEERAQFLQGFKRLALDLEKGKLIPCVGKRCCLCKEQRPPFAVGDAVNFLSCAHYFCVDCLENALAGQHENHPNSEVGLICPACNLPIIQKIIFGTVTTPL